MKPAKNIWIDLTDFLSWRGHFTGIQRVVYSYASRFNADGARFFMYDQICNKHVEVNFSFLDQIQAKIDDPPLTRRQKIKRAIGKPYYALPDRQKQLFRPLVRSINTLTRTAMHQMVDKGVPLSPLREYPQADFSADDTIVLIGAGWNTPGSLELLCEIRTSKGIRIVQHLNDILPVYQPHLFADTLPEVFNPYVEKAIRNSDVLTVISEATKRDISIFCKENNITMPPTFVVRLGEDVQAQKVTKPRGFNLKGDFILSVGTFEIRKNYLLLYQAAKLAELEGKDFPKVVIAGRKGWLTEDLTHVLNRDPYTHSKIYRFSDLSDENVAWLYDNCAFTIFPSLCEGWGLPIVESLQHGKLCIASNVSSMLEIGDGMVDYFSPYDARSCMKKILQYADTNACKAMNERIKSQYRPYTWKESYLSFAKSLQAS